jgi:hypothetical protein
VRVHLIDVEDLEYGKVVGIVRVPFLDDSGYAPVNPPEWIDNVWPQVGLISVSPANLQELPSAETLEALQGYTVLRTDRNDWIELSTDGERMWVEAERQ